MNKTQEKPRIVLNNKPKKYTLINCMKLWMKINAFNFVNFLLMVKDSNRLNNNNNKYIFFKI